MELSGNQKETQRDFGLAEPVFYSGAIRRCAPLGRSVMVDVVEAGGCAPPILAPTNIDASNAKEGLKFDGHKPAMAYLDPEALEEEAKVFGFGAEKYAPWNWRKGLAVSRLLAAVLRHIFAVLRGEDNDPESGLPHLAHARCGLAMAMWTLKHKPELDDRWRPQEK